MSRSVVRRAGARTVEVVAPARLGTDFRWLLSSVWVGNLGDGLAIAAGPLLVAQQTDSPFLIALAATLQWLPKLLFALPAGVVTDRVDRRALVIAVDVVRVVVLGLLVASILTGTVSIAVVLAALFLLGTAETFADNASGTLLPMLVHRDDLAVGNARIQTGFITVNQLAGPPLGAALFAAGSTLPFVAQGVLVLAAVATIARVRLPEHGREHGASSRVLHEVVEGFRWVAHHAAVRTLVLTLMIFNLTFGAAWSVLVLYATERLGLHAVGFGLITTVGAVGGLIGTAAYGWITRHVSLGDLMRIGLVVETLTHLGLALTTDPAVALAIFFVFGAHAFIWGTTSITVQQRAVPTRLQGRVSSVNLVGCFGGLVLGGLLGGALAQAYGVTAPFWFAFGGSAVFLVLLWGQLSHIAHADEQPRDEAPAGVG
ncbi:MFS transporter [Nocardioides marinus]|uniref:MFS family permease n=1 Tax=Nocardioides marinus TaxID=374514 RepID=A0A7Y9YEJ4_9ACTN|nr:MFS family permease [Nocardioides marinus]